MGSPKKNGGYWKRYENTWRRRGKGSGGQKKQLVPFASHKGEESAVNRVKLRCDESETDDRNDRYIVQQILLCPFTRKPKFDEPQFDYKNTKNANRVEYMFTGVCNIIILLSDTVSRSPVFNAFIRLDFGAKKKKTIFQRINHTLFQ